MGNEVEARTECVRDHLQRPDHPDRQLTNAKVGSTVNQTAPHARGVHVVTTKEAPCERILRGRQFVGIDLHRRSSMLVRKTETGEYRESVRILTDRFSLAEVMSRAGESPEVALEASYGWYWAVDAFAELGASVHLAHPLGGEGVFVSAGEND